jgi:hypothetical protein
MILRQDPRDFSSKSSTFAIVINNPEARLEVLKGKDLVSDPRVGELNHIFNKTGHKSF